MDRTNVEDVLKYEKSIRWSMCEKQVDKFQVKREYVTKNVEYTIMLNNSLVNIVRYRGE